MSDKIELLPSQRGQISEILSLMNELETAGYLNRLYRCGLVGANIKIYREIYFLFDKAMKLKKPKMDTYEDIAFQFRMSERRIRAIIKFFN